MILRVISPFNGYQVGDEITDAKEVDAVLASEQSANVVKVAAPAAPAK
ncbi:hypothetical protein [Cupriavidus sp. USMAA2-4]|nr:hypothetical protein [Cupriavidus sp. USMAA2-4]